MRGDALFSLVLLGLLAFCVLVFGCDGQDRSIGDNGDESVDITEHPLFNDCCYYPTHEGAPLYEDKQGIIPAQPRVTVTYLEEYCNDKTGWSYSDFLACAKTVKYSCDYLFYITQHFQVECSLLDTIRKEFPKREKYCLMVKETLPSDCI